MLDLTKMIKTYTGYKEIWQDGRLYIEYDGETVYELSFDGADWRPIDPVGADLALYLRSAAFFEQAREQCADVHDIVEYLGGCDELLPEELLRLLLDDCGLGMKDAMAIVLRCFKDSLRDIPQHGFLRDIQPRTAALNGALRYELDKLCYHDPYDEKYRSPLGAVEAETAIKLSLCTFGGINCAEMLFEADGVSITVPMQNDCGVFRCTFAPSEIGAYTYKFILNGNADAKEYRLTVYEKGFETPEWFRRGIMYQIFPDRFGFLDNGCFERGIAYHRSLGQTPEMHRSITEPVRWQPREHEKDYRPDDFYGGNLLGIAEKLPYLKALGVTVIYLNPIFEARSNNRYDTSDYGMIDPILGTNEDFTELCRRAEGFGIRIICDGVFSHTGADSVYFNRCGSYDSIGACQGSASKYYNWYDFRTFPDEYRSWWGFKELPEVDETEPEWQDFIIKNDDSVIKSWLRRGASGWRIDVADELPDEVLSLIRTSAKAEKPDCVIIGEVWEDAVTKESYGKKRRYALGNALDSVMNYPLRRAVIDFAIGRINAFRLRDLLVSQMMNYPKPMYLALMNLLGSHDVERLHTALATGLELRLMPREEQVKIIPTDEQSALATKLQMLCAAIQYTVPGVPCLYYGDEESLPGGGDPFCRKPFEPSGGGLHNFYAKLGKIRLSSEAIMQGEFSVKALSERRLILTRSTENEKIACVINASDGRMRFDADNAIPLLSGFSDGDIPPLSCEIYRLT